MSKSRSSRESIVFIHGRPGPHPFHKALADSVGAKSIFVDYIMQWHDLDKPRWYRYLSVGVCSLLLRFIGKFRVLISEGPHALPVFAKRLRIFDNGSITVAIMASETLYFLWTDYYPPKTKQRLLTVLRSFDALICVGAMQADLAHRVLGEGSPKIFKIEGSGISKEREASLTKVEPKLDGCTLLFIANGSLGWRGWYKGVDIIAAAMRAVAKVHPNIRLKVVGEWPKSDIDQFIAENIETASIIEFVGRAENIEHYLEEASLYIHIGRGDAFPVAILEAMAAGVPALISEWTGPRDIVRSVNPKLVVPVDVEKVVAAVLWYLSLSSPEKNLLSRKSRDVASRFTTRNATIEFQKIIEALLARR